MPAKGAPGNTCNKQHATRNGVKLSAQQRSCCKLSSAQANMRGTVWGKPHFLIKLGEHVECLLLESVGFTSNLYLWLLAVPHPSKVPVAQASRRRSGRLCELLHAWRQRRYVRGCARSLTAMSMLSRAAGSRVPVNSVSVTRGISRAQLARPRQSANVPRPQYLGWVIRLLAHAHGP